MKIFFILLITVFLSTSLYAQSYKAENIWGKTWHCYTTSDQNEPPWNGKKTFILTFNKNHTFFKKYENAVSEFSGHWDLSYAGTMLQLRGTVNEDFTIQYCDNDFLKMKNTTGAVYFFIQQQVPPANE